MNRIIRLAVGVALAAGLAGVVQPTAAVAGTAEAAAPAQRGYGYVWAHLPTSPGYTPAAAYRYNSTGGINTIRRLGVGHYVVSLPNLGTLGGVAHTTAYGLTSATCRVLAWLVMGARLDVHVQCTSAVGTPADTQFTASFTNRPPANRLAYLWADQPSAAVYTASSTYQFNSTGASNSVVRLGVGRYQVRLPGLGAPRGHVQVTAYGPAAARCKVVSWGPSGLTQLISVRCFSITGAFMDTRYSLTYTDANGPLWTRPAAYVWAHSPTTANYVPVPAYRYNSAGGINSIIRLGVGYYLVRMPGMPLDSGTVHVTAYGPAAQRCNVLLWNSAGVRVMCRTSAGALTDTPFDVAFQR